MSQSPATAIRMTMLPKPETPHTPLALELKAWLYHDEKFGVVLKHPLVFQVPYWPVLNATLNDTLVAKTARIAEYIEAKDWRSVVFFHERAYRLAKFTEYMDQMSDREYWKILGDAYVDSENLHEVDNIKELLTSSRPGRKALMNKDEQADFAALPDLLTVFKGLHAGYRLTDDFSFTTSETVAKWFAHRGDQPLPKVVYGQVEKKHVLAHFTRRNEAEILVDPALVQVERTQNLRSRRNA